MSNRDWKVECVSKGEMAKRIAYYSRHHIATDNESDDDGVPPMGLCVPTHALILLQRDVHDGVRQSIEHTFCHELVHAMLFSDGLTDHQEEFVDRMGAYLHSYFETHEGDLKL